MLYRRGFLALLVVLPAIASSASELTPATLRAQLSTRGATAVVNDLYSEPARWAYVLRQIETANADWIDVAVALRPGTDAGATSMLQDSMFVALRNAPGRVLSRAVPTFDLARVCGGRADPLPTFDEAVRELDATIAAVSAIQGSSLAARKRDCLAALEASRQHLRHFFEQ